MNLEQFNAYCETFPASSHVVQWGGAHVWKVADKVFAIGGWTKDDQLGVTFKVSEAMFEILRDHPGCRPAPYLASRGMKWVQRYKKSGLSVSKLKRHIADSHRLVALGLSKKRRCELGLYLDDA